jgi:hypothetical protein
METTKLRQPDVDELLEFLNDLAEHGWDWWKTPEEITWRNHCAKESAERFQDIVKASQRLVNICNKILGK